MKITVLWCMVPCSLIDVSEEHDASIFIAGYNKLAMLTEADSGIHRFLQP
jgi:hypothetical protein